MRPQLWMHTRRSTRFWSSNTGPALNRRSSAAVEGSRMGEVTETFRQKARSIFSELARERVVRLGVNGAQEIIAAALADELGLERAADVAFHLSDWAEDAAFLVALHLF